MKKAPKKVYVAIINLGKNQEYILAAFFASWIASFFYKLNIEMEVT